MTPTRPRARRWTLWRVASWAFVIAASLTVGWHVPTAILWVLAYCGLLPW